MDEQLKLDHIRGVLVRLEADRFWYGQADGGLTDWLRAQAQAGNVTWDMVYMLPSDEQLACEEGLILPAVGEDQMMKPECQRAVGAGADLKEHIGLLRQSRAPRIDHDQRPAGLGVRGYGDFGGERMQNGFHLLGILPVAGDVDPIAVAGNDDPAAA